MYEDTKIDKSPGSRRSIADMQITRAVPSDVVHARRLTCQQSASAQHSYCFKILFGRFSLSLRRLAVSPRAVSQFTLWQGQDVGLA